MTKSKNIKQINKQKDLIHKSIDLKGESQYVSHMTLKKENKEN